MTLTELQNKLGEQIDLLTDNKTPFEARISDCRIVKKGYMSHGGQPDGYISALLERGLERFVDALSAQYYGLL